MPAADSNYTSQRSLNMLAIMPGFATMSGEKVAPHDNEQ
jgi:hypothetical protein